MTVSQIIACVIGWTAAIVAIAALVRIRRVRRQPVRWETEDVMVTFDRKMTEAEVEDFKAEWLREYGNNQGAHRVEELRPADEDEPSACPAYQPPADPADSGLCARCGMYDYKHQEQTSA